MVIVDKAVLAPAMCMFTKTHEGPFIDFLVDFDFDHVGRAYMTVRYAESIGRKIGMHTQETVDGLNADLTAKDERIAELEAQVEELERFKDNAEYTLSAFGKKVQGKPGPKVKATA